MKIDHNLHGCPSFQAHDITVSTEVVTLYAHNILECVKALYGEPKSAPFLIFKPQHHYHIHAKCNIDPEKLGCIDTPYTIQDLQETCEALQQVDMDAATYQTACENAGIKPIYHPVWESLPFINIYQAIAPDILHQLLQGILRHLLSWLTKALGATEIDVRSQRQSPNHHTRIFTEGITRLCHITGKEHDMMSHILLALVIGAHLPTDLNPSRLICTVRTFLDFLYLVWLRCHSSDTLHRLKSALKMFHENKLSGKRLRRIMV